MVRQRARCLLPVALDALPGALLSFEAMQIPVPELLKDIRRRLALTQRGLGLKLGVTTRTVSRWEVGRTEPPDSIVPRALALLRARDPDAADRLGLEASLPAAVAQEDARRHSLDSALYLVADSLDVSPRRAREVLATFLTHLVAAGMTATDARARLAARVAADRAAPEASLRKKETASTPQAERRTDP